MTHYDDGRGWGPCDGFTDVVYREADFLDLDMERLVRVQGLKSDSSGMISVVLPTKF